MFCWWIQAFLGPEWAKEAWFLRPGAREKTVIYTNTLRGKYADDPPVSFHLLIFSNTKKKPPPAAGMYVAPLQGDACTHHTYLLESVDIFLVFVFSLLTYLYICCNYKLRVSIIMIEELGRSFILQVFPTAPRRVGSS